ncbi:hypothetical protein MBRA1_000273 [Malassezia brasiliensis]|uniref:Tip elongation aberrant protein 1 n=1 Tax=Malassezia brasiliensis TaxID=1821822 RepID=A0AAF0DQ95_9BASI|nr:hypothetical protein MBRA1_000273 [Malassezia brasiliensis]
MGIFGKKRSADKDRPGLVSRIVSHTRSESEPHEAVSLDGVQAPGRSEGFPAANLGASPIPMLSKSMPTDQGAAMRGSRDEGSRPMFHGGAPNPMYASRLPPDASSPGASAGIEGGSPAGQGAPSAGASVDDPLTSQGGAGAPNTSTGAPPTQTPSVPTPNASAPGAPSTPDRARQQNIVYPWGKKQITMNPPRFLDENRRAPAGVLSPPPFPRYGHATNQATSANNEVYIFGGLVRDSVKNDMYIMGVEPIQVQRSTGMKMDVSLNATLVQTSGQAPLPRVGHAAVLVSNVFVLWGGDTKVRAEDKQDEALYLLNLNNRDWTRVLAGSDTGAGPVGRYGHTLSIVGSNLLVFGGQVETTFFDELWRFDLNSLKSTPTWQLVRPTGPAPARRTGHSAVVYRDRLYIFGGTDGNYHYNDTWCFDLATQTWTELKCVGYIPAPREGHAACMVDDIMYIFGGRGVDGNDLGDLASFKISSHRWFMFAHMGPAPFGRSGHTMVTSQNRILVVGGESFTGAAQDDPTTLHVLDTSKIKYPAKTEPSSSKSEESSSQQPAPSAPPSAPPAATPVAAASAPAPPTPQSQPQAADAPRPPVRAATPPMQTPVPPANTTPVETARGPSSAGLYAPPSQPSPYAPPQPSGASSSSTYGTLSVPTTADALAAATRTPGTDADDAVPQAAPPLNTAVYLNRVASTDSAPASAAPSSAAPRAPQGPPAIPPPAPPVTQVKPSAAPVEVPAGEAEKASGLLEASDPSGNRELWLSSMLAIAAKQGVVLPTANDALAVEQLDVGAEGSEREAMIKSLLTLKMQVSSVRADLGEQIKAEEVRIASQERARIAALQEAAYYRAKLVASESTNVEERVMIERQRVAQLEKLLATATQENTELERKVGVLVDQAKLESRLRSLVEDRLSETTKRAVAAEEAHIKVYDEYSTLQKHSYVTESLLRDQTAQISSLSSSLAQYQAERDSLEQSVTSKSRSADTSRATLAQFQEALSAAHARTAEYERQRAEHQRQAEAQNQTVMQLRTDLQARIAELAVKNGQLEQQAAVVAELESIVSNLQREAQAHREAATGGLAQLLALQQSQGTQRDAAQDARGDVSQQHLEHVQALQDEALAMRQLHEESRAAVQNMAASLQQATERSNQLQRTNNKLFGEVTAQRKQLAQALHELAQVRDQSQTSRSSTEAHARELEEAHVKNLALRRLLAENHVEIPDEETLKRPDYLHDRQTAQLQRELDECRGIAERATRDLELARDQLQQMHLDLERQQRDARAREVSATRAELEALRARALDAEARLEEATVAHQERTTQLENDYLTAVQFVRNTENMLRRLKDEHLKLRQDNAELRAGLGRASSATGYADDTSRGLSAGRAYRAGDA